MPTAVRQERRAAAVALIALFAVATCLNAALLFAVEPMFTKMVLPLLGGSPSVWNTCLLFFQGALLVGYLYAHLTSRWLSPPVQGVVHVALLGVSLSTLPITIAAGTAPPEGSSLPILWLLALLTTTLGLPFLLLSAGAPMLQRWFAATRHPRATNPYFLYVASNLGSFAALLAYPTLLEPAFSLSDQRVWWTVVYAALIVLIAGAGVAAWRQRRRPVLGAEVDAFDEGRETQVGTGQEEVGPTDGKGAHDEGGVVPDARQGDVIDQDAPPSIVPSAAWRLRWLLLSFAPSSLLLGVTTFLTTDIASVPFLWIAPLALYLLTFVIVFARRPLLGRRFMLWFQLAVGLALMVTMSANPGAKLTQAALLHLVAFFATAMVCHRELADARPRAEYLTEFYLWMSLGGVLGGLYNVVLAPALYDRVLEYPYAMIIAFGLRPGATRGRNDRRALLLDIALPLLLLGVIVASYELPTPEGSWGSRVVYVYLAAAALVVASFHKRPLRLALGAGAIFFGVDIALRTDNDALLEERSFFGIYRVRQWDEYMILQHGTTTHGGQSVREVRRTEPLTYYHRDGPLGDVFRLTTDSVAAREVALVGLGAGTTACYARPGERWTYFEIDPLVVRIARSPSLFTYLRDCQPDVHIVLGDARLSMQDTPDAAYDLIVLDAFSSDAIPVHLITREALALYLRKLRPGGVIAFHISNRYLDLRPVLVELARDARLAGAVIDHNISAEQRLKLYYGSRWVALARQARTLAPLVREAEWDVLAPSAPVRVWTDDYSDVWGVLKWR